MPLVVGVTGGALYRQVPDPPGPLRDRQHLLQGTGSDIADKLCRNAARKYLDLVVDLVQAEEDRVIVNSRACEWEQQTIPVPLLPVELAPHGKVGISSGDLAEDRVYRHRNILRSVRPIEDIDRQVPS